MHRFVVTGSQTVARLIALCDAEGLYHVARTAADTPVVGTALMGYGPKLGFGLLLDESSMDAVCRVTFQAVRCSHEEALWALRRSSPS
jgi:hypothetical protein